ncbi:MAG: peptide chain release factor 1 [Chloroflexi bacterium]|nr:peptide chain release factor 1 [Chloroflexota bacterium]
MFENVADVLRRYEELALLLGTSKVTSDPGLIRKYSREQADIEELALTYRDYLSARKELASVTEMLVEEQDPELRQLVEEERRQLEENITQYANKLTEMLAPQDPRDKRNVIVEIRAGTGGEEAALFAADLYHMYLQYASNHNWRCEVMSSNETGIGGYKEIIFEVKGKGAFSKLKYESGVHRVQRVPSTETSGRIHTSTASVVVMPEVDEVEVDIKDSDLRIDVYRAAGHGGQGVNTTDSAVRITHLPTGIVVQCQDERSQLQNKARALSILRARIYDLEYQRKVSELESMRHSQVGSSERAEKIRTYNFPQNRVTDHRINMSIHRLEDVLAGNLDQFIDQLAEVEQAKRLQTVPA